MSEIQVLGLPVEIFQRRWRWDLSPIPRLVQYLRQEAIDIIHSFLFLPNFYSRFAGCVAGTPAIVSSLRSTGIEGWPRYALDILTCFMCDTLIANSVAGRDHYVRRGGLRKRVTVIPNGVSLARNGRLFHRARIREALNLHRFDTVIGMVGAMEWRKDQSLLIRAFERVVRLRPTTGLALVGDGSIRPSLEALAQSLGLDRQVVFLGKVSEPEPIYEAIDIYVQASFAGEGTSNSLLEAMCHSLPVVATTVGGNCEVIDPGRTGHLVPAGDVAALTRILLALLADPSTRVQMGRAGLKRVQELFSSDVMVAATEKVYERLLTSDTRGSSQWLRWNPR